MTIEDALLFLSGQALDLAFTLSRREQSRRERNGCLLLLKLSVKENGRQASGVSGLA